MTVQHLDHTQEYTVYDHPGDNRAYTVYDYDASQHVTNQYHVVV